MKTAPPFIQKFPYCSVLKAVFYGLVALLHCPYQGIQREEAIGEKVWSGWPSAWLARDKTEKVEEDTATSWAKGFWGCGLLFYSR